MLIDCQDHVLEAARSWVDLVVLESFAEAPSARAARQAAAACYALHTIEAERGYYQEHGRLSAAPLEGRRSRPSTRCAPSCARDARALVDAFGVPETALGDARVVADEQERVPA